MKRRQFFQKLTEKVIALAGVSILSGPYATALEHVESLNLSVVPDDFQKQLIKSNQGFALMSECGIQPKDECVESFCMSPALKAKYCG